MTDNELKNWSRAVKIRKDFYIYVCYNGGPDIDKAVELDSEIMPYIKNGVELYKRNQALRRRLKQSFKGKHK